MIDYSERFPCVLECGHIICDACRGTQNQTEFDGNSYREWETIKCQQCSRSSKLSSYMIDRNLESMKVSQLVGFEKFTDEKEKE